MEEREKFHTKAGEAGGKTGSWKKIAAGLILYDVAVAYLSYFAALFARFELHFSMIPEHFYTPFLRFAPVFAVISVAVFFFFRLYNSMWKYVGFNELIRIVMACIITSLIQLCGTLIFIMRMPISYYVIGAALQLILTVLSRFSYRIFLAFRDMYSMRGKEPGNVMIIGLGPTAQMIIKDLISSPNKLQNPVCIITEQSYSWGRAMEGIPVVGGRDAIGEAVEKYNVQTIVFADPSLPYNIRSEIMAICEETGRDIQNYSGVGQIDAGELSVKRLFEKVTGGVILSFDGLESSYPGPKEALSSLNGKYVIREVSAKENAVRVALTHDIVTPSDLSKQWADDYIKATGEIPSYF